VSGVRAEGQDEPGTVNVVASTVRAPVAAPAAARPADTAARLEGDTTAWDAFSASAASGSYMQLTAWAEVKAVNGWNSTRFGGRELRYVGAWELVVNPLVNGPVAGARRLRVAMARHSQGVAGVPRSEADRP
jgi:hypothetical protein